MTEPCEQSDIPFCGWDDPIPATPMPEPAKVHKARPWEAGGSTWQWVVACPSGAAMARCNSSIEAQLIAAALNAPPIPPEVQAVVEAARAWHEGGGAYSGDKTLDADVDRLYDAVDALLASEWASTEGTNDG